MNRGSGTADVSGGVARAMAALGTLALAGCHVRVAPKTPLVAANQSFNVEVRSLELIDKSGWFSFQQRVLVDIEVELRRLPEGSRLVIVELAEAGQGPCRGGGSPERMNLEREGRIESGHDLRDGDRLRATYGPWARDVLADEAARLDLLVEERLGAMTCVSLPLVQPGLVGDYRQTQDWTLGWGFVGEGLVGGLDGIDALLAVPLRLGRWVGPVRLSVSAGVGTSECARSVCPGESNSPNESLVLPVTVGADTYLAQWGNIAVGAGAHYRWAWTDVDTFSGSQDRFIQGPVFTPRMSLGPKHPFGNVYGGPRAGFAMNLEAPVSYNRSSAGDRALGIGGAISVEFPLD